MSAVPVAPVSSLTSPLSLPCGLALPNRLAKAAMSEGLADAHGRPSEPLLRLYRRWGASGLGLVITGNAVIDARHVERPGNVLIDDESTTAGLARWAEAAGSGGAPVILQVNHAGRQTPRAVNPTPTAPSAVAAVKFLRLFGQPRAASVEEIAELKRGFVRSARIAESAGFAGVQIHAAHGYLLNQFLAPDTNRRDDDWGGSVAGRARLLLEIVREVRAEVRPRFAVTVKLNTADFHAGGFTEDEAAEVVRLLDGEGLDLLELSGGTYARGASFGEGVATSAREAYFAGFAERVRRISRVPLMLTGGFRSGAAMNRALAHGSTDVVGIARPLALEPELARRVLDDPAAVSRATPLTFPIGKLRGAAELAWYWRQLRRIADGKEPDASLSMGFSLLVRMVADVRGGRKLKQARALGRSEAPLLTA